MQDPGKAAAGIGGQGEEPRGGVGTGVWNSVEVT